MPSKKSATTIDSKQLGISVALTLALGLGGGYLVGSAVGQNHDHDSHSSELAHSDNTDHAHDDSAEHSHGDMFMVDAEEAPTVDFTVEKDAKSGYNVRITTTNFTFTPSDVNSDNVAQEGHAHLYVDGEKVSRLYGPDYHYSGDADSTTEFRVTLNANDHSEYAVDGEIIEAVQKVEQ